MNGGKLGTERGDTSGPGEFAPASDLDEISNEFFHKLKRAYGPSLWEEVKAAKKRQRSASLPAPALAILQEWYTRHKSNPYPNANEKEALARTTGLTPVQVANWFINVRKRRGWSSGQSVRK